MRSAAYKDVLAVHFADMRCIAHITRADEDLDCQGKQEYVALLLHVLFSTALTISGVLPVTDE